MNHSKRIIMEGVFAINKPPGATSRFVLDRVNRALSNTPIFQESLQKLQDSRKECGGRRWRTTKLKMGHGGTLDPLAEGVLVIGVGNGTKTLGEYTNGSIKMYECVGLLGGSTTTGDSEGELIQKTANDFITNDLLEETRQKMVGTIDQTPPIFSALKMDGKPLYEYARQGLPLPRAIKSREVSVYDIQLKDDCLAREHEYKFLKSQLDEDGETLVTKLAKNPTLDDHPVPYAREWLVKAKEEGKSVETEPVHPITEGSNYEADDYRAPIIHFDAKVSSGTYIRSLLSDFGRAMGSSSYMVKLVRWNQAEWDLKKNVFEVDDFEKYKPEIWVPVMKKVFENHDVDVRKEIEEQIKLHPEGVKTADELAADKAEEDAKLEQIAAKRTERDQNSKGKRGNNKRKKYNNNNNKNN